MILIFLDIFFLKPQSSTVSSDLYRKGFDEKYKKYKKSK